MSQNFIDTTMHDFKTNFSAYVRLLEEDPRAAIIVHRYNKPVGLFLPMSAETSDAVSTGDEENTQKCDPGFDLSFLINSLD